MAEPGLKFWVPRTSVHASKLGLCQELGQKLRKPGESKKPDVEVEEKRWAQRGLLVPSLAFTRLLLDEGDTEAPACPGHYLPLESCPQRPCQAVVYLRSFACAVLSGRNYCSSCFLCAGSLSPVMS